MLIGRMMAEHLLDRLPVSMEESTKKGKRAGTTDRIHRLMPCAAPSNADLESRINASIPSAAPPPTKAERLILMVYHLERIYALQGKNITAWSYAMEKGGVRMGRRSGMLERIFEGIDLPGEVLPGQPLVELSGDGRVLIENHRGVTEYRNDRIAIQVSYGHVIVIGQELELTRMCKEQLVILGRIESITLCRR